MDLGSTSSLHQLEHCSVGGNTAAVDLATDEGCVWFLRGLGQQERESVSAALRVHTTSSEEFMARLASMLPPHFVAGPPLVPSKDTPHGQWVKKRHVMVRAAGPMDSCGSYIGVKTEHEFRPNPVKRKGDSKQKKVFFALVQYHDLREEKSLLVIEEETTLCKVRVKEEDKGNGKLVEGFGEKRRANFGDAPIHLGSSSSAIAFPLPAATVQLDPGAVNPFTNTPTDQLDTQILLGVEPLEEWEIFENFFDGPGSEEELPPSEDPGVLNPFTSSQPDTHVDVPAPKEDPLEYIGNYLIRSPGPEEQLPPQEEERVKAYCKELQKALNGSVQSEQVPSPVPSATVPTPAVHKSDVWKYHTRIYRKDLKVVYAACNKCDDVLRACSKNGTNSLRNHPCTIEAMAGVGSSSNASACSSPGGSLAR